MPRLLAAAAMASLIPAVLVIAPPPCAAAPDSAFSRHTRAAARAVELGRYEQAVRHYEAAYGIKRDERLLYNIALAKRHLGQAAGAAAQKRTYLLAARDLFRRFIALTERPRPGLDAATAKLIGRARLDARKHLRDIEALLRTIPAAPSDAGSGAGSGAGSDAVATTRRSVAPPPKRGRPGRPLWKLAVGFYSAAAAMAIAAGFTGGFAVAAESDSHDLAASGDGPGANSAADRADRLAIATDILVGGAIACAVVGLVVHLFPRKRRARPRAAAATSPLRAAVGPGRVGLTVSF